MEQGVTAVFDVLSKHVDRASVAKLAGMFPKELRKFWPAFIQEAARERQQGAACEVLRPGIRPSPDQILLEGRRGLGVGVVPHWRYLAHEEDVVAKGQQRSTREKKKPKQDKKKVVVPSTPIGSTDQRGKPGQGSGTKKRP